MRMTSWHSARRWGRPQAVCGCRWAPGAPCPAQQAVACRGKWGPWRSLRRGKAGLRHQARGRDLPGWTGPDRAWGCWRSSPDCWPSRGPGWGHCSWHWGPRHSGGAEGSYLDRRKEICFEGFPFFNPFRSRPGNIVQKCIYSFFYTKIGQNLIKVLRKHVIQIQQLFKDFPGLNSSNLRAQHGLV